MRQSRNRSSSQCAKPGIEAQVNAPNQESKFKSMRQTRNRRNNNTTCWDGEECIFIVQKKIREAAGPKKSNQNLHCFKFPGVYTLPEAEAPNTPNLAIMSAWVFSLWNERMLVQFVNLFFQRVPCLSEALTSSHFLFCSKVSIETRIIQKKVSIETRITKSSETRII